MALKALQAQLEAGDLERALQFSKTLSHRPPIIRVSRQKTENSQLFGGMEGKFTR